MKHRLLFSLLLLLVSMAWTRSGQAATITTSVLNGPSFCRTTAVRVSYTVGGTIDPSNVFTAQLSDDTGSFAAPTAIGSFLFALAYMLVCWLVCRGLFVRKIFIKI